jgi:WD40 repeat protein
MIIWDLESQDILVNEHFTGWVSGLGWSWNGRLFASASSDHETIEIRDGVTFSLLYMLNLPDTDTSGTTPNPGIAGAVSLAWAPGSEQLAIGLFNGPYNSSIVIWDVANRRLLSTLRGHSQPVYSVAWSPDSKWLASGGNDRRVIIWNAATGEQHITLLGHTNKVFTLAWSPNGKRLASGGSDGRLIVWDPNIGQPIMELSGHFNPLYGLAWDVDSSRLAVASRNTTVHVVNARYLEKPCQWVSRNLTRDEWSTNMPPVVPPRNASWENVTLVVSLPQEKMLP